MALLGRREPLFVQDLLELEGELNRIIAGSSFLVLGAAGSIGQAVTAEIFRRNPRKLHAVDLSENNLVELVRDLRSSLGYIRGEFKTFALDIGSPAYDALIHSDGDYDFILNLSALKHVRSEKDPYTLMRMVQTNILNTQKTIRQSIENGTGRYFCVSTDKAANPVNMMGASKKIMEMCVMSESRNIPVAMARFANVAFSDGSLLHGFRQRMVKRQPIAAPADVRRYFITPRESGELCLISSIFGENRDILFPKLDERLHLVTFSEIATCYIRSCGYEPVVCSSEEEARHLAETLPDQGKWPCFFSTSNTTGEKEVEEFYTADETLDMGRYQTLGVIKNSLPDHDGALEYFGHRIGSMLREGVWTKEQLVQLFQEVLPEFKHKEEGKYLDEKM